MRRSSGFERAAPLTAVSILVTLLFALVPMAARAVSFGPNLSGMSADPSPPICYWLGGVYGGCTLYDPTTTFMLTKLPDPIMHGDQTGVVTAMHVVAATTEPAQFVVIEFASKVDNPQPFPSGVSAVSQPVTLHPGLNNFNTNLPVDARLTKDGYEVWSAVAISILASNAPAPIASTPSPFANIGILVDNYGPITTTSADLTVPPHNPNIGGLPGTLLVSGDLTVTTPQPQPQPQPQPLPKVTLPATATVRRNTATLRLRCAAAACKGTVRIRNRSTAATATGARAKLMTYATGSFSLRAGATASVATRLSADGRRALKHRQSLKAFAVVTLSTRRTVSAPVTLRK
jgi:hypothetical protein